MVLITMLLLISFALFLFCRTAETPRMRWVFFGSGMAVWAFAFLAVTNESAPLATATFAVVFFVPDFVARPILKRRLTSPRVRVNDRNTSGVTKIVFSSMVFCWIAFLIFQVVTGSIHSIGSIVGWGLITVIMVFCLILALFERIEICGNGLWQHGRLQPWEEYEYFAWEWKTKDIVELRHASKSWLGKPRLTRLMVAPEDRKNVQQLLEAHLPELSAVEVPS